MESKVGITIVEPSVEFITPKHFPNWKEGFQGIIEECGRTCYKSEDKIKKGSAEKLLRALVKNEHMSVIEHGVFTVKFTCSRACSHQLVRHRLAAYSQESQRFCDYSKDRHQDTVSVWNTDSDDGGEQKLLKVIMPPSIARSCVLNGHTVYALGSLLFVASRQPNLQEELGSFLEKRGVEDSMIQRAERWCRQKIQSYQDYLWYREEGVPSEDARFDLPNACKTEVATTYNFRMWRHVLGHPKCGRALNKKAQWEIKQITLPVLDFFQEHIPSMFGDLGEAR